MAIQLNIDATSGADLAQQLKDLFLGLALPRGLCTVRDDDETTAPEKEEIEPEEKPVKTAKPRAKSKKAIAEAEAKQKDLAENPPAVKENEPADEKTQARAAAITKTVEPKEGEPITIETCRAVLNELSGVRGMEGVRSLFKTFRDKYKFAEDRISLVPVEAYQEFYDTAKELMA